MSSGDDTVIDERWLVNHGWVGVKIAFVNGAPKTDDIGFAAASVCERRKEEPALILLP